MLAVEKARRLAEDDGLRVLYVCFNEGLADFVGKELGYRQRFDVFSYYSLVRHFGPKAGVNVPEYHTPEVGQAFFEETVPNLLLQSVDRLGPQYDAIVLDEMQDFPIQWWDSLFFLLQDSAQGIFYAFSDPYQAIFPPPRTKGLARASADFVSYRLSVPYSGVHSADCGGHQIRHLSRPSSAGGPVLASDYGLMAMWIASSPGTSRARILMACSTCSSGSV